MDKVVKATWQASRRGRAFVGGVVLAALVLVLPAGLGLSAPALADPDPAGSSLEFGDYRCGGGSSVYYGNRRLFRAPCEVSVDRIYRHIPEYREILEKGLTEDHPRYHFLMREASARFARAVKEMAEAFGHDLVAELGTVTVVREGAARPPDRTADVISRVG
ncbi:MAG: hypothetical protein ACYTG6_07085 [Planctomycetota bacterium]|jgi:hypothetical protein